MRCLAVIFVTVKIHAKIADQQVSFLTVTIIENTPLFNIDFEWQYYNGFVSGAYWYYQLYKNGSWGDKNQISNSMSYSTVLVELTGATKIRLGCHSNRSFAPEQEEEPEEDDMLVIGYRNDIEYDSKSFCGGGKTDVYIDIPINSLNDNFKLELVDYLKKEATSTRRSLLL